MGASLYYLKMPVNLTKYRGRVGAFNTRKSIFQWSCNTFSSLNYVNINSSQHYLFSTFILLVFLLMGLKHNSPKNSMKLFVLFLFLIGFLLNTYFGLQRLLIFIKWDVKINLGPTHTSKASLSICHWNLNSISADNYIKLSLLKAYLVFHKFDIFVFQKHISILVHHLMMTPCKYWDTI